MHGSGSDHQQMWDAREIQNATFQEWKVAYGVVQHAEITKAVSTTPIQEQPVGVDTPPAEYSKYAHAEEEDLIDIPVCPFIMN